MNDWTYNHLNGWKETMRSPLTLIAESDNSKLEIIKDKKVIRILTFKKDTILTETLKIDQLLGTQVNVHWEPQEGLIKTEILE